MGRHSKPSPTLRNLKAVTVLATATAVPAILAIPAHASTGTLGAIEKCESGGDPTAQNPSSTASGAFQFLDSTWNGFGGYKRAKDAPYSVQLQKAQQTPLSAWDASRSCWGGQTGTVSHSQVQHHVETYVHTVPPKPTRHLAPVEAMHVPKHHYPSGGKVYHVVSGDTLSGIAEDNGTSWPSLYANNRSVIGGDPNLILPGQALRLH